MQHGPSSDPRGTHGAPTSLSPGPGKRALAPPRPTRGRSTQVLRVRWLNDRTTGLFYGSAFVEMASLDAARRAVEAADGAGIALRGRRLRVRYAPAAEGASPDDDGAAETERPSNHPPPTHP